MKPQTRLLTIITSLLLVGGTLLPVDAEPASTVQASTDDVTLELIQLLVETGVLKQEQAAALLARARTAAAQRSTQEETASPIARQPDDVRVTYVPQTVQDAIGEQVKRDVIAKAKTEHWAQPNTFPDWVSRITIEGDVRVRDEFQLYDDRNSAELVDYQRFNDDGPIPTVVSNQQNPYDLPWLNSTKDRRNLWRYRARLAVKAAITDHWQTAIRLASGNDDNPVSTTGSLGGGMEKKDIWLDQVYLRYQNDHFTTTAGRAANPFWTTDVLFSDDLQFDGLSFNHQWPWNDSWQLLTNAGAFILEHAHNPWRAETGREGGSEDKWLYGVQLGLDWHSSQSHWRGAIAYFDFDNISGKRSSSCTLYTSADPCDTDWSRSDYMQKGNTLFLLRDIDQWSDDTNDWNEWQYVGLAAEFTPLDLHLYFQTMLFDDLSLRLNGDYLKNLAYDKQDMIERAAGSNNIVNARADLAEIKSGDQAWLMEASFGRQFTQTRSGDWWLTAGYKYIEPDALPDAYNDSSFHLGGTNAKGYYLGGSYVFADNVWGQLLWSSSKEVYGAPLSIDVLRFDLNARF